MIFLGACKSRPQQPKKYPNKPLKNPIQNQCQTTSPNKDCRSSCQRTGTKFRPTPCLYVDPKGRYFTRKLLCYNNNNTLGTIYSGVLKTAVCGGLTEIYIELFRARRSIYTVLLSTQAFQFSTPRNEGGACHLLFVYILLFPAENLPIFVSTHLVCFLGNILSR